jgi:hypothetical protein
MGKKRFSDRPTGTKQVEFEIDFWDGDKATPHSFLAYPAIDTFAIARINKLSANERTAVEALGQVKDAIRTLLDDSDGTPLDWSPTVLPREAHVPSAELATWPSIDDEPESGMGSFHSIVGGLDDEDEAEPQFVAPDSTVHPWSEASKYTAFEAGSSRRRWVELMDGDNDLRVEAKTVTKAWQWLISEAAERPTVR